MNDKKTARLPLIAFAALPLTLGLVMAQTAPQRVQPAQPGAVQNGPQSVQPAQPGNQAQPKQAQRQQSGTNYANVFLQKLAAQLGISTDKLKAAAIAAGSSTIDQGVKAGDFPNEMAQDMKQKLQENPFALAGGRGHGHRHDDMEGGRGGDFGPGGMRGGDLGGGPMGQQGGPQGGPRMGQGERGTVPAAVAKALGLDEQALLQQLQSGKTIADLAGAKGVSTVAIHNAAVAALRTDLAAAVKEGRLTQAQADQMVQRAQADANFGLQFGGRGGRGMRGNPGGNLPQGTDNGVVAPSSGI